jgi:FdhD protein
MTKREDLTGVTPSGLQKRSVYSREAGHAGDPSIDLVAEEVPVAITYNGKTHAVMMASPIDLEDFALGFSLTEGIVDSPADINQIGLATAKQGIAVQLKVLPSRVERIASRQRSLSGRAGCGICGLSDISAAVPNLSPLKSTPLPSHIAVDRAAQALQSKQALQQACGGIHGAALCNADGEILILREDIGRHNALDKLIGAAHRASPESPFESDDFVLLSSRASHELVNKCVIAGIHNLVTISAASSLAIDVAQRTNLNLVGFVRGSRQLVYSGN